MKKIEVYQHNQEGYNPFLIRDKWQVAFLNYAMEESLEKIDKLDVHFLTDEVFLLTKGSAVLIGATIEKDVVTFETIYMKANIAYNIPQNMWHKIAMQEGSQVLIVENCNTHLGDFEFYDLSPAQKKQLKEAVNQCINTINE